MIYFFNNCQGLHHETMYGGDAFFDLWKSKKEDGLVAELRPDDTCWVAGYRDQTKAGKRVVVLRRFSYTGSRSVPDPSEPKRTVWVLDGKLQKTEMLPKEEAARHPLYSCLFNVRGHFKQVSFVRGA